MACRMWMCLLYKNANFNLVKSSSRGHYLLVTATSRDRSGLTSCPQAPLIRLRNYTAYSSAFNNEHYLFRDNGATASLLCFPANEEQRGEISDGGNRTRLTGIKACGIAFGRRWTQEIRNCTLWVEGITEKRRSYGGAASRASDVLARAQPTFYNLHSQGETHRCESTSSCNP